MPSWAAVIYVTYLGAVVAWTVSPRSRGDTYFAFAVTERTCVAWRNDLATAITTSEWQVNLLLLVPLGATCAFARDSRARRVLLCIAAATPIAIEGAQYLAPSLYRVCEGTDVVTNWLGLTAGCAAAAVVLGRRAGRRGRRTNDSRA